MTLLNKMIKLQDSTTIFNTYDRTLSNLLPSRFNQHASRNYNKFLRTVKKDPPKISNLQNKKSSSSQKMLNQVSSKTINLKLNETCYNMKPNIKINEEKQRTSTEFIYIKKKSNYISVLKEKSQKWKTFASQTLIKSKPVSVFNFSEKFFYQDLNLIKKKKSSKCPVHRVFRIKSQQEKNNTEVVVIKENAMTRMQSDATNQFFQTEEEHNFSIMSITEKKSFYSNQKKTNYLKRAVLSKKFIKNQQTEQYCPFSNKDNKKKHFSFGPYERPTATDIKNKEKLLIYHDFIWKVNFSNSLFVRAIQKDNFFKVYVGPGNNSNMIKSIIARRFWFTLVDNHESCNFSWNQIKIRPILQQQKSSQSFIKKTPTLQEIFDDIAWQQKEDHRKILNSQDLLKWTQQFKLHEDTEKVYNEKTYKNRLALAKQKNLTQLQNGLGLTLHNHFVQNEYLGNKKALYYLLKDYYKSQNKNVFQVLPLTYHMKQGLQDPEWKVFQQTFQQFQTQKRKGKVNANIWIMKPGQNSNRGNGITICHDLEAVRLRLKSRERNSNGSLRTFILQKYIDNPLLYHGRKFDIRHYLLLTCYNGIFKAYWFEEGYVRTSSSPFNLKRTNNLFTHLTNDAIQKNSPDYGKYEDGNKVSYNKLHKYIKKNMPTIKNNSFFEDILPKMKEITTQTVKATYFHLDPQRKEFNFQLFGMDFMIDSDLRPWLIQINTNPCLETSCPLLSQLIPQVIEQTFRLCVDPLFPPPQNWPSSKKYWIPQNLLSANKFHLIFDETIDKETIRDPKSALQGLGKVEDQCQVFENEGLEWRQGPQ